MPAPFRQGMQPAMFGPPMVGASTPQNNEGLGLPGGQAIFNLPRTNPIPGTSVNFTDTVGGPAGYGAPSLKLAITRTASSDPVQNILNDYYNPLGNTNIGLSPEAPPPPPKPGMTMNAGAPPVDQFAPIGARGDSPFPIGVPNFEQAAKQQNQMPQFGLRNRMTQAAMRQPLLPYAFL